MCILHSTLVWASTWLILWALLNLLFPVFCDVPKRVNESKELSLDRGVLKEEQTITEKQSGLGIEGVSGIAPCLPQCVKLADSEPLALQSEGDVVIGGLFPLHYVAPTIQHSYSSKPQLTPCSRCEYS